MFKLPHDSNRLCLHCHMSDTVNQFVNGMDGANYVLEYRKSVPAETVGSLTDRQLLLGALACAVGTILGQAMLAEGDATPENTARIRKMVDLFHQSFNAECTLVNEPHPDAPPEPQGSDGGAIPEPEKGTLH